MHKSQVEVGRFYKYHDVDDTTYEIYIVGICPYTGHHIASSPHWPLLVSDLSGHDYGMLSHLAKPSITGDEVKSNLTEVELLRLSVSSLTTKLDAVQSLSMKRLQRANNLKARNTKLRNDNAYLRRYSSA